MAYETTTKAQRNQFVIAHMGAGRSLSDVCKLLVEAGYPSIDKTRVWKIWKRAPEYKAVRTKIRFCNFCLEKASIGEMFSITNNNLVFGKICKSCWNRLNLAKSE